MIGIIFIAPPAAGKGTQSDMICQKYGFIHVSTGDLLREASKQDNLEALYIQEEMEAGKLIDDGLIMDLLINKLSIINNSGFILDGFPRNLSQAHMFEETINKLNIKQLLVFYIDVPFDVALKRTLGRLICSKCNHVYNSSIKDLMPASLYHCDDCKSPLSKRIDDTEDTFTKRFNFYISETKPLVDYYSKQGVLYRVDGNKDKNNIFMQIDGILNRYLS